MATPPGGGSGSGGGLPSNQLGGMPLVDPLTLYADCAGSQLSVDPWWGKANTFTTRAGEKPGTGAVLMRSRDLLLLNRAADHDLILEDNAARVVLKRLTITRATCVAPSAPTVGDRVYLVELADRRLHLARVPIDKAYNLRTPGGGLYVPGTLAPGLIPWTWTTLVTDIWNAVGGLGTFPGLPFTPDGVPEGLDFYGGWAWSALNNVLERIACVPDYDPIADTFSIVRIGAANSTESNALTRLGQKILTWEGDPSDGVRADRPEKVRVLFRRTPVPVGSSPFYAVDVTLTVTTGVVAGTFVQLSDDLYALGLNTPSNAVALATRAAERAADWLRKYTGRDRRILRQYRDLTTDNAAVVGGTATVATWDDRAEGLRAELVSGPDNALEDWQPAKLVADSEVYAQYNALSVLPYGGAALGQPIVDYPIGDTVAGFARTTFATLSEPGTYLFEINGWASIPPWLGLVPGGSISGTAQPWHHEIWTLFGQLVRGDGTPFIASFGYPIDTFSDGTSNSSIFPICQATVIEIADVQQPLGPTNYGSRFFRSGGFGNYSKRWVVVKTTSTPETIAIQFVITRIKNGGSLVPTGTVVISGILPSFTLIRLNRTWWRNIFQTSGWILLN